MDRLITIFVRNRMGGPINGADIRFSVGETFLGSVNSAEGRGALQVPGKRQAITVEAAAGGETQTAKLGPSQDTYTFKFGNHPVPQEDRIPLLVGLLLLGAATTLAFVFQETNALQTQIIRILVALGAGAVGSVIPGMLNLRLKFGTKLLITAAGALAIYVITFFFVPAG